LPLLCRPRRACRNIYCTLLINCFISEC
jgi:hypothetical protein